LAQQTLWSDEGKPILDFLKNTRHISEFKIKQFNIGYCPRSARHELAGRVIMPIYDPYNNLVAITTRDFDNEYFSHWHEAFDKSNYLYGLNLAKEHIRRNNKAILVEGQFDVMCLHSYGLTMTVGVLGSAFSIMQAAILLRYCSDIYLLFDPDNSGQMSTQRALDMYAQYKINIYRAMFIPVVLPNNQDPDDFIVSNGVNSMIELLRQSKQKCMEGKIC